MRQMSRSLSDLEADPKFPSPKGLVLSQGILRSSLPCWWRVVIASAFHCTVFRSCAAAALCGRFFSKQD